MNIFKKINLIICFVLACLFTSCDDSLDFASSNDDYPSTPEEIEEYMAFIAELQEELGPDYKIYHMLNSREYSDSIEQALLQDSSFINAIPDKPYNAQNSLEDGANARYITRPYDMHPFEEEGGNSGEEFDEYMYVPASTGKRLSYVYIRAGKNIDALKLYWKTEDGVTSYSQTYGGSGGKGYYFSLEEDEYIKHITIRYGSRVDKLIFTTNHQNVFTYGRDGGQPLNWDAEALGKEFHGFKGRHGRYIYSLGAYSYSLLE